MFKIIGADQKQYGPISVAQIRHWLSDGRLNEDTQAQREGSSDWQPLSSFEEFADIFHPAAEPAPAAAFIQAPPSAAPLSAPIPAGSRDGALIAVRGPAIALIISSSLGILLSLLVAAVYSSGQMQEYLKNLPNLTAEQRSQFEHLQSSSGVIPALIGISLYSFVIFGAIKMMRLQSFGLAFAACIVAMVPCVGCGCVLGLPFGIWGLVMLNKAEIKSQFDLP